MTTGAETTPPPPPPSLPIDFKEGYCHASTFTHTHTHTHRLCKRIKKNTQNPKQNKKTTKKQKERKKETTQRNWGNGNDSKTTTRTMGNKGGPTENISKQIHTWGDKEGVQQLLMCWCGACKQFVSCCFTPGQPVRLPRSEEGKTTAAYVKHTYTYNNNKTNTGTRGRWGGGGEEEIRPG